MIYKTDNGSTIEYKPFALVFMSRKANSVKSYFFDSEVCELMHQGKHKEALDRARVACKQESYRKVGIETITREVIY